MSNNKQPMTLEEAKDQIARTQFIVIDSFGNTNEGYYADDWEYYFNYCRDMEEHDALDSAHDAAAELYMQSHTAALREEISTLKKEGAEYFNKYSDSMEALMKEIERLKKNDSERIIKFIQWYWKEVDGQTYNITAEQLYAHFNLE